ncbi:META domain-containing protein [Paracoccus aurantiacus]|uniref:META domain-containing protein n=1 Tax=Paracoccus aurantiacus TaxID=2599412 RepID=A0A5C6S0Z3_9RHOB|nr:META domain-containing protein [Paracoccus aurantiacus]TXB68507.1 META domain-containing protein [Paracoccus aurantiacus]
MTDFNGSYRLIDIDGSPIPGTATLQISDSRLSGTGPCNAYTAQNSADWPVVDLPAIASTRRACLIEGGEARFLDALGQVTSATRSAGTLTLRGPDHVLRFSDG